MSTKKEKEYLSTHSFVGSDRASALPQPLNSCICLTCMCLFIVRTRFHAVYSRSKQPSLNAKSNDKVKIDPTPVLERLP